MTCLLLLIAASLHAAEPSGAVLAEAMGGVTPKAGAALSEGSAVTVGKDGGAVIVFAEGTKVRLGPKSAARLVELSPTRTELSLESGAADFWVKPAEGRRFLVRTGAALAHVKGTVFSVSVDGPGRSTVRLYEGSLSVTDNLGRTRVVEPGLSVAAHASRGMAASVAFSGSTPPEPAARFAAGIAARGAKSAKEAPRELPAPPEPEPDPGDPPPLTLPQSTVVSPSTP